MIDAKITGDQEVIARFDSINSDVQEALKVSVMRAAIMLLTYVKADKLSGGVLNVKTGRLRRSINQDVIAEENSVIGQVGTNVSYGRYWELGFDRKLGAGTRGGPGARGGRVLTGKALASYYTKHPAGSKHEQRSFLASSLMEKRAEIIDQISSAVNKAVKS